MLPSASSIIQQTREYTSPTPHSRHNNVKLPKIKVPEYHALSTPEATPNMDHFSHRNSSPSKPSFFKGTPTSSSYSSATSSTFPPISKFGSTNTNMTFPATPMQTPQAPSSSSFSPFEKDDSRKGLDSKFGLLLSSNTSLSSVRSLGDSLARPSSASNSSFPPLMLQSPLRRGSSSTALPGLRRAPSPIQSYRPTNEGPLSHDEPSLSGYHSPPPSAVPLSASTFQTPRTQIQLPPPSQIHQSVQQSPTTPHYSSHLPSISESNYTHSGPSVRSYHNYGPPPPPPPPPSYRPYPYDEPPYTPSAPPPPSHHYQPYSSLPPPPPPPTHTHPSNIPPPPPAHPYSHSGSSSYNGYYGSSPLPKTPHSGGSPPAVKGPPLMQDPLCTPHTQVPPPAPSGFSGGSKGIGLGIFTPSPVTNNNGGSMMHGGYSMKPIGSPNNTSFNGMHHRYHQHHHQPSLATPTPFKPQMVELTSSREIKRRTKTGCMTCRKRRIKCDERHPTCFNCDKSKRICISYDPVFRASQDRRRTSRRPSTGSASTQLSLPCFGSKPNSPSESNIRSSPELDPGAQSHISAGNAKSPKSTPTPPSRPRNKMDISSLLDAVAVIETTGSKREADSSLDSITDKRVCTGDRRSAVSPPTPPAPQHVAWYEDKSCYTWDRVEAYFAYYIAPNLDALFALQEYSMPRRSYNGCYGINTSTGRFNTSEGREDNDGSPSPPTDYAARFSQMSITNLACMSGLPLDGTGSMTIPGSNSSARGNGGYGSTAMTIGGTNGSLGAPIYFSNESSSSFYSPDGHVSSAGSATTAAIAAASSSNCTVRIGQSLAILETVRQLVGILCPSFYVDHLGIDETSVGKLEELRISNDYRALRAIFQLLVMAPGASQTSVSALKETDFLSVGEHDGELLSKVKVLNRFANLTFPSPSEGSKDSRVSFRSVNGTKNKSSSNDGDEGLKSASDDIPFLSYEDAQPVIAEMASVNRARSEGRMVFSNKPRAFNKDGSDDDDDDVVICGVGKSKSGKNYATVHPGNVWTLLYFLSRPISLESNKDNMLTDEELDIIVEYASYELGRTFSTLSRFKDEDDGYKSCGSVDSRSSIVSMSHLPPSKYGSKASISGPSSSNNTTPPNTHSLSSYNSRRSSFSASSGKPIIDSHMDAMAPVDRALAMGGRPPFVDTGAGSLELSLLMGVHYFLEYRRHVSVEGYANGEHESESRLLSSLLSSRRKYCDGGEIKTLLMDGVGHWPENAVMRRMVSLLV